MDFCHFFGWDHFGGTQNKESGLSRFGGCKNLKFFAKPIVKFCQLPSAWFASVIWLGVVSHLPFTKPRESAFKETEQDTAVPKVLHKTFNDLKPFTKPRG